MVGVALALAFAGGGMAPAQEKTAQEKTVQEKDAEKKEPAIPAVKSEQTVPGKTAPKKEEKPAEKPAEPPEKPATAADFPELHKKWTAINKQLSELSEKYQLAPSSEERSVLRGRYQKLVTESEKLLPQLKANLPASVDLSVLTDRTVTIRASVEDVRLN